MTLRPYQSYLIAAVRNEWAAGNRNVCMVLSTGGGKTVCLADIVSSEPGASCVIAHRQEIVSQLSIALGREGVRHNVITSDANRKSIVTAHMEAFGKSYYDPNARCAVASVDTLLRAKGLEQWAARVVLIVTDEGHHWIRNNKWDKAAAIFTNPALRCLLPTATPQRADGQGLGRHADGVADAMVEGPPMRWLIDNGYLCDYRVVCVDSHMDEFLGDVAASGDWSNTTLRSASQHSEIAGDVVESYRTWANGKLGITFSTDVETATEMAAAYRNAGVAAEVLTGSTDPRVRSSILKRFAARDLTQLVAVDIISEGFDLPALEVATFARPTASLAVYMQQFGRALRPMEGKDKALIIDHVGNFLRHGAPDRPRIWTLDRRDKRRSGPSDAIPMRVCLSVTCAAPYERFYSCCPYCGTPAPEPAARAAPDQVDGVLRLLDDSVLALLRGQIGEAVMSADDYRQQLVEKGCPAVGVLANVKRHATKREAQEQLRAVMSVWGGRNRAGGLSDEEMQRLFYLRFGVDVLTAQTLGQKESLALIDRIVSSG